MVRKSAVAVLLLGMAPPAPLTAQAPAPRCLVPSHVWDGALPVEAADHAGADAPPVITVGQRVDVRLRDAATVRYAVAVKPARAGRADGGADAKPAADKAGLLALRIAAPGTYRFALQRGAWIDVVHGGRALASAAHRMGGACSGIRKMVDFRLRPGGYLIQLSHAADDDTGLIVTKQP